MCVQHEWLTFVEWNKKQKHFQLTFFSCDGAFMVMSLQSITPVTKSASLFRLCFHVGLINWFCYTQLAWLDWGFDWHRLVCLLCSEGTPAWSAAVGTADPCRTVFWRAAARSAVLKESSFRTWHGSWSLDGLSKFFGNRLLYSPCPPYWPCCRWLLYFLHLCVCTLWYWSILINVLFKAY